MALYDTRQYEKNDRFFDSRRVKADYDDISNVLSKDFMDLLYGKSSKEAANSTDLFDKIPQEHLKVTKVFKTTQELILDQDELLMNMISSQTSDDSFENVQEIFDSMEEMILNMTMSLE